MQDAIDDICNFIDDVILEDGQYLSASERESLALKITFWTCRANFSGRQEVMKFVKKESKRIIEGNLNAWMSKP